MPLEVAAVTRGDHVISSLGHRDDLGESSIDETAGKGVITNQNRTTLSDMRCRIKMETGGGTGNCTRPVQVTRRSDILNPSVYIRRQFLNSTEIYAWAKLFPSVNGIRYQGYI